MIVKTNDLKCYRQLACSRQGGEGGDALWGFPDPRIRGIGRAVLLIVKTIDLRCYRKLFCSATGVGALWGVPDTTIRGIGTAVGMIVKTIGLGEALSRTPEFENRRGCPNDCRNH